MTGKKPSTRASIEDRVTGEKSPAFQRTFASLLRYGLLLESDPKLPSVTCLVTGQPVRGSWWAHPQAHAIFAVNCLLADHPDVLIAKLISGKVTFVHRPLWNAVFAVALACEPWQVEDLSKSARALLDRVTREDELRTDQVQSGLTKGKSLGEAARELESKLLVYSEQIHTDSGSHAKCLQTWERWATRVGLGKKRLTPERAKKILEEKLEHLNQQFNAHGLLPWQAA